VQGHRDYGHDDLVTVEKNGRGGWREEVDLLLPKYFSRSRLERRAKTDFGRGTKTKKKNGIRARGKRRARQEKEEKNSDPTLRDTLTL